MGKPYSMDLRERVVAAVEETGISRRKAAAHFGVSARVAIEWVRHFRETGNVAPSNIGGYKPKKISGAHLDWLLERCREKDFTLRGLAAELAERYGNGAVLTYLLGEKPNDPRLVDHTWISPSRGSVANSRGWRNC